MFDEKRTGFLNVDLDIVSTKPLAPLVQAFGRKVDVLHTGRWGRRYGARLELAGSGHRGNPDPLIRRLVALVESLPRASRRVWDGAQSREFNVGIEAVVASHPFELRLEPRTLAAVARVGGRIAITVYAPRPARRRDDRKRNRSGRAN